MKPCIELKKICKRFGDILANDNIDLTAYRGEIHSIVGGNGAGKTTLMNILYGLVKPDSGEIFINGEKTRIKSSRDAISKDIGMIHQEFLFIESMDAIDNIILGKETVKNFIIDKEKAKEEIVSLSEKYHLYFDTEKNINELSIGERQRIEIVKVLYRNAKILILDEPTGILTPQESKELFNILRALKESGSTIIFISHKLNEVMEIADRISIMQSGRLIDTISPKDTDINELAVKMIGGELPEIEKKHYQCGEEAFVSIDSLSVKTKDGKSILKNVSFEIKSGEIFGIAGIEGNGQKELEECLTGNFAYTCGTVSVRDEVLKEKSSYYFKSKGISWIPSNRNESGLISGFRLYENFILGYQNDKNFSNHGILKYDEISKSSKEIIENYEIAPPDIYQFAENLSGGNQQKIVIGREFSKEPLFLVAAHPTRGVDIKGSWFIHKKLKELKENGSAILIISSYLDELFSLCDRIGVLYDGEIIDIVSPEKITFDEIGVLMLSGKT